MSEIIDNPTILPIHPNENPFDDEFKSKWYDRYKNEGCTLDHIQRLYNLDKITLEDFKLITNEEPKKKVIIESDMKKLENKISILEVENAKIKKESLEYRITQNRLQLTSMYSADSVTFKVDYNGSFSNKINGSYDSDLYTLILNNILVGKDNYNYDKMFGIIMDYASWSQISWEQFDTLCGIMDLQYNLPVEPPIEEAETPLI